MDSTRNDSTRLHQRDGALFRGRYKAIVVDKDSYLAQVVRYIHLNLLGVGLVHEQESYAWSSHRFYLRRNQVPGWLRIDEVMNQFSSIAQFHKFVLEGNASALEKFYKNSRHSPVLGDEKFRNKLMETPLRVDREHPRYERAAVRPSLDQLLETLANRYEVEIKDLMKGRRGKDNEPRKVGMYLAKELCDLKAASASAVSGAAHISPSVMHSQPLRV